MRPGRDEIEADVLRTLEELAQDWEYGETVGADTGLFGDLGFESLDAVVLGTLLQEHYDQPLPFSELLADVGQREVKELTVGEIVSFVEGHLAAGMREAS